MGGSEIARCEGQYLKGKTLGFDHEKAGKGESNHGTPVGKGTLGEAGPAAAAGDKAYVENLK